MKVLLATDGSKTSEEAAWLLAHLPHSEKLELTIMSVCYVYELHGALEVVKWVKESVEKDRQRAQKACERAAKFFEGANADVEIVFTEGHVGKSIVDEADKRDIDLIVLGSVGHSALERIILGSVGDFVVSHATCSVLIVRPTGLRDRDHKKLRVCIAYDDSDPSKRAIKQLHQFQWGDQTEMEILNVVAVPFAYDDIPALFDIRDLKIPMQKMVDRIVDEVEDLSPNVNSNVIDAMHIGEGITNYAMKQASDIVVLGDSGNGLMSRFLRGNASLGSVAKYVVRHSPSSVWIARQRPASH
jgi:nucleotide-binding universal stress UspA family protein